MEELKCLICYHSSEEATSPPSEEGIKNGSEEVIFVLRYLLEVPREEVVQFREKWGDPLKWIRFCGRCQEAVVQAKSVYDQMLRAKRILKKVKQEFVEVIKKKRRKEKEEEEDDDGKEEGIVEVTKRTRQFVERHEYSFEGDSEDLMEGLENLKSSVEEGKEEDKQGVSHERGSSGHSLQTRKKMEVSKEEDTKEGKEVTSDKMTLAATEENVDSEVLKTVEDLVVILSSKEQAMETVDGSQVAAEETAHKVLENKTHDETDKETSVKLPISLKTIPESTSKPILPISPIKTEVEVDNSAKNSPTAAKSVCPSTSKSPQGSVQVKQEAIIKTEVDLIKGEKLVIKQEKNEDNPNSPTSNNNVDKPTKSIQLSMNIPKLSLIKPVTPPPPPPPKPIDNPLKVKPKSASLQDCIKPPSKKSTSAPEPVPSDVQSKVDRPKSPEIVELILPDDNDDEPLITASSLPPPQKFSSPPIPPANPQIPPHSIPPCSLPPPTSTFPPFPPLPNLPPPPIRPPPPPQSSQNLLQDLDPFLQDLLSVPKPHKSRSQPLALPPPSFPRAPSLPQAPQPSTSMPTPYPRPPQFTTELTIPHGRQGQVLGANGSYRYLCLCGKTYISNSMLSKHVQDIKWRLHHLNRVQNPPASFPASPNTPLQMQNAVQELRSLQQAITPPQPSAPIQNPINSLANSVIPGILQPTQPIQQQFQAFNQSMQQMINKRKQFPPIHRSPKKVQRVARAHFSPRTPPKPQQLVAAAKNHLSQRTPPKLNQLRGNLALPPKRPQFNSPRAYQPPPTSAPAPQITPKPYLNSSGYFCEQCLSSGGNPGKYDYLCELDQHLKMEHGGWYKCTMSGCSMDFTNYTNLDSHWQTHQNQQKNNSPLEGERLHAFRTSQAQVLQTAPIKIPTTVARKKTTVRPVPMNQGMINKGGSPKMVMSRQAIRQVGVPQGMGVRKGASPKKKEEIVCIQLDD